MCSPNLRGHGGRATTKSGSDTKGTQGVQKVFASQPGTERPESPRAEEVLAGRWEPPTRPRQLHCGGKKKLPRASARKLRRAHGARSPEPRARSRLSPSTPARHARTHGSPLSPEAGCSWASPPQPRTALEPQLPFPAFTPGLPGTLARSLQRCRGRRAPPGCAPGASAGETVSPAGWQAECGRRGRRRDAAARRFRGREEEAKPQRHQGPRR